MLLHPRNSPSGIALELNLFLLTFMGLFGVFSPPSQHIWLFSVVNLPEVLRSPGLTRLWFKGAYSKSFFMSITWVTCSTDVCEITCTKGNIEMVSHIDNYRGPLYEAPFPVSFSCRPSCEGILLAQIQIDLLQFIKSQVPIRDVNSKRWTVSYLHENTGKGIKHLQAARRIKDIRELHLRWKLQHHHPLWVIVIFSYFAFWNSCWHLLMYAM